MTHKRIIMKKIISILTITLIFVGCSNEDYEALNRDPNNPTAVDPGQLFVAATKTLFDQIESTSVNRNVFRLFAQYWTETTYVDEANYDLANRRIPGWLWNNVYRDVLYDLKDAKKYTNDDPFKTAQIGVLEVYAWQVLVDAFGDIPYNEALKANEAEFLPAYDDAANVIYPDLLSRIDEAIGALTGSAGSGFGNFDLIYQNNRASWLKFAYSLKIKLAMRLADVDGNTAKTSVESAYAGAFDSNADNARLVYESSTPNTNPIWESLVQSGRNDFIPANTIVDYLNTLEDPRREVFFDPSSKIEGAYLGGTYGAQSSFGAHSHIGTILHNPTFRGILLDYAEVCFNLSEAAARGWNVGGTAEEHYNAGIKANFEDWGIENEVDAYLQKPEVAYPTAPGDWKEKIAMQYWIAMYNRGFEGWYVYRKFDAPKLNIAANSKLPVPKRYTYPISEQTLNAVNWKAASNDGTSDLQQTPIFWDK